jgi:hypothetical protein
MTRPTAACIGPGWAAFLLFFFLSSQPLGFTAQPRDFPPPPAKAPPGPAKLCIPQHLGFSLIACLSAVAEVLASSRGHLRAA